MDDKTNLNVVEDATTQNAENEAENNVNMQPKTFDDLLKEPGYQAEFDKKVAKALDKAKAKWQKEEEAKRTEAEALARMSEEEKYQHELSKIDAERSKAVEELNAYKLKEEALKIATDKGLDVNLLNVIDFAKETAESVKTKIDSINDTFNKAVESRVNDKFKQSSPKQVENVVSSNPNLSPSEKKYLDDKYKKNPYYKG